MAVDAISQWALINGYSPEEVDYNLTQWHKVDTQVFSGAYDRLLGVSRPECATCPQIGFLAISCAKGNINVDEAEHKLAGIQATCEGARVHQDDWNPVDGDQFFVVCDKLDDFRQIKNMSW